MITPRSAPMSTFEPAVLLSKLKAWAIKVTRIFQTIKVFLTKSHCWRSGHKRYNLCTAVSSNHLHRDLYAHGRLYDSEDLNMLEPYRGTLLPQALDLGLTNPILEDPRAINTKYFKPETWANHVKNHLGQQQFAKFVNVMAERIRMQTSKADEICAFAKLLGDEQEWNLLSVGVAALNESGVFNRMGSVFDGSLP